MCFLNCVKPLCHSWRPWGLHSMRCTIFKKPCGWFRVQSRSRIFSILCNGQSMDKFVLIVWSIAKSEIKITSEKIVVSLPEMPIIFSDLISILLFVIDETIKKYCPSIGRCRKWKKAGKNSRPGLNAGSAKWLLKIAHRTMCKPQGLHEWQRGFTQLKNTCGGLSNLQKCKWLKLRSYLLWVKFTFCL